jgi:transglutaminase-like putative cysteine protease
MTNMTSLWRLAPLPLLAAAPGAALAPTDAASWSLMVANGGETIGHASHEVTALPDGGREIVDSSELSLQELANPAVRILETSVTRQDAAGRTLSIATASQTGGSWARIEARIEPGAAEFVRRTVSERRMLRLALPPGTRFDDGAGLLADWDPATTPRLEYDALNVAAMSLDRVVIAVLPGAAPEADGGLVALRTRYDRGELRGIARLQLDRWHRIVSVVQPLFGTAITTRAATREAATRPRPPYHLLPIATMRSPFRIPASALQGHARYRISFADGLSFPLPQTGEQRSTVAADGTTTINICAGCGVGLPTDPASLADARRATAWLQSDHPRLRAIAAPIARMRASDARKMVLLIQRARPYIERIDFTGHYSALETLQRRAGDCTEAAALLAALGRAAGIPTKVASGLVYARGWYHGTSNVFMPHSWVLAYADGAWRSFDLALDEFDTSHIALTIGDGDARSIQAASQLAGLLHWDGMTEIRPRPASQPAVPAQ